ncbi:hypothetical protein JCM10213_000427 [Rhodosporidiobolus nylandii]
MVARAVPTAPLHHLTLPALLRFARGVPEMPADALYGGIDCQRDWLCSADRPNSVDEYLVNGFEGGQGMWSSVRRMTSIAASQRLRVRDATVVAGLPAPETRLPRGADEIAEGVKRASGGLIGPDFDWTNVMLAGGSVLALATGKVDFQDLDLFIYGLEQYEVLSKARHVLQELDNALWTQRVDMPLQSAYALVDIPRYVGDTRISPAGAVVSCNSQYALTYQPPGGRPIQVVLIANGNRFETLAGFDLDACGMGFDGKRLLASPRAVRALSLGGWRAGTNFFDPILARASHGNDPRFAHFASRVQKYAQRGFSLALPKAAVAIVHSLGEDLPTVLAALRQQPCIPATYARYTKAGGLQLLARLSGVPVPDVDACEYSNMIEAQYAFRSVRDLRRPDEWCWERRRIFVQWWSGP